LTLFNRVPVINNSSTDGKILVKEIRLKNLIFFYLIFFFKKEKFDGEIVLNNLEFRYPNRPEVQVLKNINLTIEPRIKIIFLQKKILYLF
jgi:ABC-type multidrug transport system fused ATPase/permease subunit